MPRVLAADTSLLGHRAPRTALRAPSRERAPQYYSLVPSRGIKGTRKAVRGAVVNLFGKRIYTCCHRRNTARRGTPRGTPRRNAPRNASQNNRPHCKLEGSV